MTFSKVMGQDLVKQVLNRALERDRLAGSYLFFGPEGVGKWATALEVAKRLNCQKGNLDPCGDCASCKKITRLSHPDITLLFPLPAVKKEEEKEKFREEFKSEKIKEPYSIMSFDKPSNIAVEEIREMQRGLSLRPYEAKRRVVIVYQAEKMAVAGANSLLKSLEEPPLDAVLILTSSEPSKLLPTILSRCQKIRFLPLADSLIEDYLITNYKLGSQQAHFCSKLSRGSLGKALSLMDSERSEIREDGVNLLRCALKEELVSSVELVGGLLRKWDRDSILAMFDFLFTFLRDIYLYLEEKGDEDLLNLDLKEKIIKLAGILKERELVEEGMDLISRTKEDCIKRNANLELSLLALVLSWRSYIRR
jgi:DNA polymerase III subunit delta'